MKKIITIVAFVMIGFLANAQSKLKFLNDTTIKVIAVVKNDTLFIKSDMPTFVKEWNKQRTPIKFKWIVFEFKEPESLYFPNYQYQNNIKLLNN